MEIWIFLVLALRFLIQYLQPVGDGLDEETLRLRMEVRAKRLEEERIRLERMLEQLRVMESGSAWGDLLWSPLQHWQLWACAVLLVLLLALWFMWRKRSLRREEHEEENDGANEEEVRNMDANEEEVGNGEEVIQEAANAENNEDANEVAVEDRDADDTIGRIVMERIQWPVWNLRAGCEWTHLLVDYFIYHCGRVESNSFYPVLQRAIPVGSAFEGWSPREEDVEYQFLVPMTPPRGHSFHLELSSARQRHLRHFCVRVELECTCRRKRRRRKNMLCFLHQPEEELRSNQAPSLLGTLCTGSYLDVQKTGRWFYQLVRAVWPALPRSHNWHLVPLPSRRSCQIKVTNGRESFRIEMVFGVQRGDSDIFVTSQSAEPYTLATAWLESYAVAEMKLFRHMARMTAPWSLHLKCLQFFTQLQLGLGFHTYIIKTIAMRLMNVLPESEWCRRDFVKRILDISRELRVSLERKCLNHFILGNQRLPLGINLPQDVQTADTLNLFHHLATDPVAHSLAMSDYDILQERLGRILDTAN